MRRHAEQGQQPDYEKVVGHHDVDLCEADRLDADPGYDLLVAEGGEEFAEDAGLGARTELIKDDGHAEEQGKGRSDDEGEEDL